MLNLVKSGFDIIETKHELLELLLADTRSKHTLLVAILTGKLLQYEFHLATNLVHILVLVDFDLLFEDLVLSLDVVDVARVDSLAVFELHNVHIELIKLVFFQII